MKYHLEWPNELQALERKFLLEIEELENQIDRRHAPTFIRIIEKKVAFLNEILDIMDANPTVTLDHLAQLVDQKLEVQERELKNAKNIFKTDKIFDSVRILGWIKYMTIEKNGRVTRGQDGE